jgi:hypothetical protein
MIEQAKTHLAAKLAKKPNPSGIYRGAEIHRLGDDQNGYVVLVRPATKDILYFVHYLKVKLDRIHYGRSVLTWREENSAESIGFAYHIVNNYLLPKYGRIVSDTRHTDQGKRFWQFFVVQSLSSHHIYGLDRSGNKPVLTRLRDIDELNGYFKDLWGHHKKYQLKLMVVSQQPFELVLPNTVRKITKSPNKT